MATSTLSRVDALIAQMTLDEKLAQIGSVWMHDLMTGPDLDPSLFGPQLKAGIGQITRLAGDWTLAPVAAARAANQIQKFLVEQTRLGIPAIIHEECCSGAMMLGGSTYPQMIGLASTFEPELAKAMAESISKQLRAIGARQGLAPVLDIGRDARWGRTEETFGEDPLLVGQFGMAYVRGLQGEDLRDGVVATGKHFIGHSGSQGGLNCAPVQIGMRELYDVYLGPFHAVIRDAGLGSIMNAYPEIDGELVAASRRILTDLLRGKLGFDGLIVSDYEAVKMIHSYQRVAPDLTAAARLGIEAGIDVELPASLCYADPMRAALEAGDVSIETIDQAVRRHLQMKEALGLFDQPYVDEGRVLDVFETPNNRTLAREIARKSMVLLKNDGMLPLAKSIGTLAVIGPNADSARCLLGDYSYAAMSENNRRSARDGSYLADLDMSTLDQQQIHVVTVLQGIKELVSPQTRVIYARGCDNLDPDTSGFAEAIAAASEADAVILVLGDRSGLVPNCTTGETRDSSDVRLPGAQEKLACTILRSGKPAVIVLVNGRPLAIPALAEHASAVLEAWLPGEEGGAAVAETLFGDNNPGGKLAMTFPRSGGQTPIFYNHKPSAMRSNWHIDYVNEPVTPLYPFGHGLSYTTFGYSELAIDRIEAASGDTVAVSCEIANNGTCTGEEVVQLYICDEYGSLPRPVKELKGYARVTLSPGQCRRVRFDLPVDLLAFHDENLDLVVEPGTILVMVGSSSEDIRLRGQFTITGPSKVKVARRLFVCPVDVR